MNLNTRQRFQETPAAKEHLDRVVEPGFRAAVEAALLEYQLMMTAGSDPSNFYRIKGAQEFVTVLMNIAEPSPDKAQNRRQNLDHHA